MEWLANMWSWVVAHKDAIVTFVTSSSFIGFITTIIMLVKQSKTVKSSTVSSNELTVVMRENNAMNKQIDEIKTENEIMKNMLSDVIDALDKLTTKQNATLEVQSLVYQSLRDEGARVAVQNILTNAKYADTATRASLIKEIEILKAKAEEEKTQIVETANKIKKTLASEKKKSDILIRG